MVGYMTKDDALVITAVAGPGKRGRCTPDSVTIDGNAAEKFCARERKRANGGVSHVGDWHVHNDNTAQPSPRDREALRQLPLHNEWGYAMLSLILTAALDEYVCISLKGQGFDEHECSVWS